MQVQKGDLLALPELDDCVHQLQLHALDLGMLPIAGIISQAVDDGRHRVLGFGWNQLRLGIPGIHGETGALINMGRRPEGYADLVATSSLSPCPFCQNTLAAHLGIRQVRVLDATNYTPDFSGYARIGLTPVIQEHPQIVETFKNWVNDPSHTTLWNRDIGEWSGAVHPVFDVRHHAGKTKELLRLAVQQANQGLLSTEAPIGAVIVDHAGEVIGSGHAGIKSRNDPTLVAAMSAWRACGARDHWKDKTLFLSAGPDAIAYSMFHVFGFGQLVVGSTDAYAGQIDAVRKLGVPVHVLDDSASAELLSTWLATAGPMLMRDYLGAVRATCNA